MGYGGWSDDAYKTFKSSTTGKATVDVFAHTKTNTIDNGMDPKGLKIRECRDSTTHPNTLAIQIWLDVTGSMGEIPDIMVREKLDKVIKTLLNHNLPDVAVLFGAIGDHISDQHPLQVGQFESGTEELIKWLTAANLEGGGGGQCMESYLLAWLIAARHTSIDCFEKRQEKGVLFTIGDEKSWDEIDSGHLIKLMGCKEAVTLTDRELLKEAQKMYHVFHIHCNETGYRDSKEVIGYWKKMLGERVIICQDFSEIAEIIATTTGMIHGADIKDLTKDFDRDTAERVEKALVHIDTTKRGKGDLVVKL